MATFPAKLIDRHFGITLNIATHPGMVMSAVMQNLMCYASLDGGMDDDFFDELDLGPDEEDVDYTLAIGHYEVDERGLPIDKELQS